VWRYIANGIPYSMARNIYVEFNLTFWQSQNRQIYIRQYEFSKYYKPLVLYHFIKLKFAKTLLCGSFIKLFPINNSDYTALANAMPCSQNRNLKCNRICKLPASSLVYVLFYNPYSSFLNYQILHYLVVIVRSCVSCVISYSNINLQHSLSLWIYTWLYHPQTSNN